MLLKMAEYLSFSCLNNIPLSVDRYLDYLHILTIVNNAVMNMEVQIH